MWGGIPVKVVQDKIEELEREKQSFKSRLARAMGGGRDAGHYESDQISRIEFAQQVLRELQP